MTAGKRMVVLVGTILLTVAGLVPPWQATFHTPFGEGGAVRPSGWAPLWSPPLPTEGTQLDGVEIDIVRLTVEWVIVVAVTAAIAVAMPRAQVIAKVDRPRHDDKSLPIHARGAPSSVHTVGLSSPAAVSQDTRSPGVVGNPAPLPERMGCPQTAEASGKPQPVNRKPRCRSCGKRIKTPELPLLHRRGPLCPSCWTIFESTRPASPLLTGSRIAGWLLLPAIHLILAPLLVWSYPAEVWEIAGTVPVTSIAGDRAMRAASIVQPMSVMAMVASLSCAVVCVLFFAKAAFIPRLMVFVYPLLLVYELVAWRVTAKTAGVVESPDSIAWFLLKVGLVFAWTIYFARSRRVRATFCPLRSELR